jgi:hypothetical protein
MPNAVRRRTRFLGLVAAILVLGSAAACGVPRPTASTFPDLSVSNQTSLTVVVSINGTPVDAVPPHEERSFPANGLPPLPWAVRAATLNGRPLIDLTVSPGDVFSTTNPVGSTTQRGDGARLDLSCGRLDLWVGPPMSGPPPGPGAPGDCEP